ARRALDHRQFRLPFYAFRAPKPCNVGGPGTLSRGTIVPARDYTVAVSDTASLSNATVNELRAQFTRSRFAAPGNDQIGPAVSISGVANFGASTSSPTARNIGLYEVV